MSWRLPAHILARLYTYAEIEGVTVTSWVERAVAESLRKYRVKVARGRRTPRGPAR